MTLTNKEWIELVKATRQKFGVSIEGAHDLIFADEEMRRLIALRINRNQECRKMALYDIRSDASASRFVLDGDRIRFRKKDGQR